MDNTILGALIGAVIAIVSTYINARQGYKNSIRLERQKILRDKREQLFINCILAEKVIDSSAITILNFVKMPDTTLIVNLTYQERIRCKRWKC
ncbi:hypothetical protein [Escherichia coli]|uniref:hypothetical protein n=1 Tax=Escherichia coli TaxID=562 RepID=UPI001F163AB5|nr:hypothetical protein [Escherichia coli]